MRKRSQRWRLKISPLLIHVWTEWRPLCPIETEPWRRVKVLWFQFPAVGWPVKGSRRVNTEDATPGWRELDVRLITENLTGFEGQTDSQMAEDIFSMGAFSSCEHLELITRSLCLEIKISPVVVLRVTLDQVVPFWYQRVNICPCHDIHHLCLLLVFILYQFTQVSSLMVMAWPSRMIAPPHKVKGLAVLILFWGWLCRSLAVVPTVLNMFTVWSSVFSQTRLSCCCWVKRFSTWTAHVERRWMSESGEPLDSSDHSLTRPWFECLLPADHDTKIPIMPLGNWFNWIETKKKVSPLAEALRLFTPGQVRM